MRVIIPSPPLRDLETEVIQSQLRFGDQIFANGEVANNHLDLGFDEVPEDLHPKIALQLGEFVSSSVISPDFIAPVPRGAVGWGRDLVTHFENKPELIVFDKIARRIFRSTDESREQTRSLMGGSKQPTGIVIDDATSDGGTSEALAERLEDMGMQVSLVASIFLRGDINTFRSQYDRAFLIARHIPYSLDWTAFQEKYVIQPLDT